MSFHPLFSRHRVWAGLAALLLLGLALLTAFAISQSSPGPGMAMLGGFLLLLLAASALLIYRLWLLHSLDYWVQRDAIHIHAGGEEIIIPLPDILAIKQEAAEMQPAWLRWPLLWVQTDARAQRFCLATQPPANSLTIITADATYLISPRQPEAFIAAYEQRRDFGPARRLQPVIYLASWRQHWLLRDHLAQGLIFGGLLLGLLTLAYVVWRFPGLPAVIALHYNAKGAPNLLSPRRSIFLLPGIALLAGFLNAAIGFALYEYQRTFSYLLWGLSVVLQIAAFFIAANLINLIMGR